jgi:hypothetical protein
MIIGVPGFLNSRISAHRALLGVVGVVRAREGTGSFLRVDRHIEG